MGGGLGVAKAEVLLEEVRHTRARAYNAYYISLQWWQVTTAGVYSSYEPTCFIIVHYYYLYTVPLIGSSGVKG